MRKDRAKNMQLSSAIAGMLLLQGKSFLLYPQRASGSARTRWPASFVSLGKQQDSNDRYWQSSLPTVQGPQLQGKTVASVMEESIKLLNNLNCPEPVESTIHLLASCLGLSWASGYRELRLQASSPSELSQRILNEQEAKLFNSFLARRVKHEPIQYILGQWDFMDYTIKIRPPLLCPRPETEELVELVIRDAKTNFWKRSDEKLRILDIGCGTGCIGIALADQLHESVVLAIDVDPVAIETTQENARRILGETANWKFRAELISVEEFSPDHQFDVIVSNPPYIPSADMMTLDSTVIDYESARALHGGEDGLDVIRIILSGLARWLVDSGSCWMEVDPTHPALVNGLVSEVPELTFGTSVKDFNGKDRFIQVKRVARPT